MATKAKKNKTPNAAKDVAVTQETHPEAPVLAQAQAPDPVAAVAATAAPQEPVEDKTDMFLRQRGLVNMRRLSEMPITIIGAGGIGSGALLALAQMGARNITVYDDDTLEIHNISNQVYPMSYVGKKKVVAARDFIKLMYDFDIKVVDGKYDGKCGSKMIISGVDSMESRKAIWEMIKVHEDAVFYMDARMGGLNFIIFNELLTKPDHTGYERSIVKDELTMNLPCTARSTGFNVLVIGGYLASLVRNYLARQSMPPVVEFDMANNIFNRLD